MPVSPVSRQMVGHPEAGQVDGLSLTVPDATLRRRSNQVAQCGFYGQVVAVKDLRSQADFRVPIQTSTEVLARHLDS